MKIARLSFLGVLGGALLLTTFLALHTRAASQQATLPVLTVTLAKGPLVSKGTYRYAITLSGFPANTSIPIECYDSVSPNGFFHFTMTTDGNGNGFEQNKCYSGDGPDHWVVAGGWLASNHVQWWNGSNPQPRAVTLTRGPIYIGDAFRYQITLSGFPANTSIPVECYDSVSPSGFSQFTMTTDGNGNGFEQNKCYSGDGPDHWVVAGGVTSNHVQWGGESNPQPTLPEVTLTRGPVYSGNAYRYAITVSGFPADTTLSVECYDSVSLNGFFHFTITTDDSGKASAQNECYSGDGPDHWVIVEEVSSNHVQWGGTSNPATPTPTTTPTPTPTTTPTPTPTTTPTPTPTYKEQEGHLGVNTFTNPHNASGMGQKIPAAAWVEVSCKVYAPEIPSVNPDGYWYRIASSPWNNAYYAPANTFMNGDPWGGPYTHNTDFSVPDC